MRHGRRMGTWDRLLERQASVVHRRQALELGWTPDQIKNQVRRGAWRVTAPRRLRDPYRATELPVTDLGRPAARRATGHGEPSDGRQDPRAPRRRPGRHPDQRPQRSSSHRATRSPSAPAPSLAGPSTTGGHRATDAHRRHRSRPDRCDPQRRRSRPMGVAGLPATPDNTAPAANSGGQTPTAPTSPAGVRGAHRGDRRRRLLARTSLPAVRRTGARPAASRSWGCVVDPRWPTTLFRRPLREVAAPGRARGPGLPPGRPILGRPRSRQRRRPARRRRSALRLAPGDGDALRGGRSGRRRTDSPGLDRSADSVRPELSEPIPQHLARSANEATVRQIRPRVASMARPRDHGGREGAGGEGELGLGVRRAPLDDGVAVDRGPVRDRLQREAVEQRQDPPGHVVRVRRRSSPRRPRRRGWSTR